MKKSIKNLATKSIKSGKLVKGGNNGFSSSPGYAFLISKR